MLKSMKSPTKSITKSWKRLAAAGVATAAVALSIASVSAQDDPLVPPTTDQQTQGLFQGRGGMNGMPGGRGQGGPGQFGGGQFGPGMGGRMDGQRGGRLGDWVLVRFVADELGIEPSEIIAQLQTGDVTLAQVVTDAGGDATAVFEAALAAASERINQALENGRIDQTQADALLAQITDRLTTEFNTSPLEQRIEQLGSRVALEAAADSLDTTARALINDLRDGRTLSEILSAGGVDVSAFSSDVVARVQARLNVQVVDGVLTPERAADLLASFQAELQTRLNEAWVAPLADAVQAGV